MTTVERLIEWSQQVNRAPVAERSPMHRLLTFYSVGEVLQWRASKEQPGND